MMLIQWHRLSVWLINTFNSEVLNLSCVCLRKGEPKRGARSEPANLLCADPFTLASPLMLVVKQTGESTAGSAWEMRWLLQINENFQYTEKTY